MSKLSRYITKIALVIAFASASCAPSIREDLKNQIDNTIGKYSVKTNTYEGTGKISVKPWKVGQWVKIKGTDKEGNNYISTVSVTRKDGSAFWLEISTITYFNKSDSAILIDFVDYSDPSKTNIIKMKMRDENGKITDFEGDQLKLMGGYQSIAQTLQNSVKEGNSETVTVPAGTFKNSKKVNISMQTQAGVIPISSEASVWYHSAVPIYGWVKSISTGSALWTNTATTEEILDFGEDGAKSAFF
ncbi:MAG: hypothetical protein HY606_00910 [Planctomycetes bacterium]|nr:hypothetical protein [Planctomycetota bacterium]